MNEWMNVYGSHAGRGSATQDGAGGAERSGLSWEERVGQADGLGLVRDDRPNEHY